MRYRLEERHKRHLARLGVALVPEHLEIDDAEYQQHYADWKITLPRAAHEILHMKVLGHAAWKQHAQAIAEQERVKAQTVTHKHEHRHKFPLWVIGALVLLLGLLIVPRAHCQFSKINSIDLRNNDNSAQGFVTYPFKFKAGANCSWSPSGSTFTFNCSGAAASPLVFWQPNADRNSVCGFSTNDSRVSGYYQPYSEGVSVSKFHLSGSTADAVGLYGFALYNSSGTRVAHSAPAHITNGDLILSFVEGTVTLSVGKYILLITGNANTGTIECSGGIGQVTFQSETFFSVATSGGNTPASITFPADNWVRGQLYYVAFHQ